MKKIPLSRGLVALVDDCDFDSLSKFRWHASSPKTQKAIYALRTIERNGKSKKIYMHRVVLNAPIGLQVDHVNGNGLDNRRSNLRLCVGWQNTHNIGKRPRNTSGFKGVTFNRSVRKWQAQIEVKRQTHYLGLFLTPELAFSAYVEKGKALCGEFFKP